jgi:hypothetical protein
MAAVVVVVAEFGVSRGDAARARAGLKQAWRAGSGIVKPNCDGFGSGGGACIVAAGDACVVCRVVCAGSGGLGRRAAASLQRAERGEGTRRRWFAGRRRDEQADGGLVSAPPCCCSAATAGCCRVALPGCPWARCRSTASDASHPSLSICLPLLLVLPVPAAHPLARPRPSSQHPALHRTAPPALSRNGRLTPVVRNARWLRPKIAPPSLSQSSSLVRRQSGRLARY